MRPLNKEIFACLDCETTGLEPENDRVIEIAVVLFTFDTILESFESLINPGRPIPEASMEIHHITNEMVADKPTIQEVLPKVFSMVKNLIIVGHGITLDLRFITEEAKRCNIPCKILSNPTIDTLRLARLYGESPTNSLETLRQHFNISGEGAHRAMSDVLVNIEVFKFLATKFSAVEQVMNRLQKPILLKAMPLGKHKGRPFSSLPLEYLYWASHQNFDQDLLFSIQSELKRRKKGNLFEQSSNPFFNL